MEGKSSNFNPIKTNQNILIDCSKDLIWSVDKELNLITANCAFKVRVEKLSKSLIAEGKPVLHAILGEEIIKNWTGYYKRALAGERFSIKDATFNPERGSIEYALISFNPMYNADGLVFGAACFARDVTEDTVNLLTLEKTKSELQRIMDSSLDMICVIDEQDRIVKISAAAETILGYKPEELIGKHLFDFIHPEDKEQTKHTAAKIMAGQNLTNVENRYIRKDGSVVPLIWSARWDSGDKVRYGIARDATEKKKNEEALVASERMYRYLFEKNPFPIVIWDFENLRIVACNEAACHQYGYSREEFLNLNIKELRPAEDIPLIVDAVKTEAAYGEYHRKTWRHKKKNGELMYADVTGHLMDYQGRRVALNLINDITESHYYQELDKLEKNVLKLNAGTNQGIANLATMYLGGIEALHPGMRCIVKERKGSKLFNFAASGLPPDFWDTEDGIDTADGMGPCGVAAFSKQPLMIEDISTDERWPHAHGAAKMFGLKTCCSFPILGAGDQVMATLAVFFNEIKRPTEREENTLQRTVQFLQLIMESDQRERALKTSNERFEFAAEATSDVIWDWNLETNTVYYSHNIEKLFGHDKAGVNADNLPFYFDHVHPDDRDRVVLYPEQVKFGKMHTWAQEYRFKKANGDYATVLDKGIVIRDKNGIGKRMIGAIQDITTLKRQNEQLTEIALINAHEIRRPVATILGLMQLFAMESDGSNADKNLLEHLEKTTLELDEVIRRIISKTER